MPIHGYPGGVISATPPTVDNTTASGVWTTEKQLQYQAQGLWPMAVAQPISRSLRFNSADSAYLNRTPASAGNQKVFTWSGWYKRGKLSTGMTFFGADTTSGSRFSWEINSSDALNIAFHNNTAWHEVTTAAVFRDPSAWYHIVVACDLSQATSSNRVKVYVNGVQQTLTGTYPPDYSSYINSTNGHQIGRYATTAYYDGLLTEINFIDGQQLTPSSFGQTNSITGVWEPKAYSGTYGTNGFYLNFSDNSNTTAATLGKDYSGNGNNWTPNNFSVTAGAGNDSMVDTPTPYGSDTGAGGTVRGNYCTMNPLNATGATPANGNLDVTLTSPGSTIAQIRGTIAPSTGKWYWENVITSDGNQSTWFGVVAASTAQNANLSSGQSVNQVIYSRYDGTKIVNGTSSSYGSSYTTGDIIGVALDLDGGTVTFYKNNTSQGSISLPTTGIPYAPVYWWSSSTSSGASTFNFGQRPFAYTAPSGFKALCTQNLSTPTVAQGDDYFNTVLYTGNGSTQSITGVGFQPDFVWNKARSAAYSNRLADVLRGATNLLNTDSTGAAFTDANSITSFNADGFSVGNSFDNTNAVTYVAWNWKANGTGSSNTAGSITSTVSANTTSGFSVVTYTGNGSATATVGHGLGVAPSMFIVKSRSDAKDWIVYHVSLGNNTIIKLNSSGNTFSTDYWQDTTPSSSIIYLNGQVDTEVCGNNITYVIYAFAAIAGYSAFGSYTGNGSSDGPFVYTGFRPAFVLIKNTTSGTADWVIYDTVRNTYNTADYRLLPNSSSSELTRGAIDFLSNGMKMRNGSSAGYQEINTSGQNYIYAAFASNPFKYALAR
jgi:hypothetical protein